jgi:hypothetical protein
VTLRTGFVQEIGGTGLTGKKNYSASWGVFPHFYPSRNATEAGHYYIHNDSVWVDPRKPIQGVMPAGECKPVDTLFFKISRIVSATTGSSSTTITVSFFIG